MSAPVGAVPTAPGYGAGVMAGRPLGLSVVEEGMVPPTATEDLRPKVSV
jgi:hypothetical protein